MSKAHRCAARGVVARVLRKVAGSRHDCNPASCNQVVNRLVKANRGRRGDGHGDDSWHLLIGGDPLEPGDDVAIPAVAIASHGTHYKRG